MSDTYAWEQPSADEAVEYDVDVMFGAWPSGPADFPLADVRERLARSTVANGLALSTRGALFDDERGNAETVEALAGCPELHPVGTVNLRDAVYAERRLDWLSAHGVRFLRLFPALQGVAPGSPGLEHTVTEAVARGLVVMLDGDPRAYGPSLRGRGATVVFLDLHAYLVADFVLMAREEPGFLATTRMLSGPDSLERVVDAVGAEHLVFGSGMPRYDLSPATLRLRYAAITAEQRRLIAGDNVARLLAGSADADR